MEIVLSRCTLRPWRPGDETALVRHANNRNVSRNMRDRFPYPYTPADAAEWIERTRAEHPVLNAAIIIDGAPAGGIGLVPGTDVFRRSAEIGYWLAEAYWGHGIATEALEAMTAYAFAALDICRREAGVFEWNPASARVLEKAGYTLEGRLRRAVTKHGRTADRFVYARLRDDA